MGNVRPTMLFDLIRCTQRPTVQWCAPWGPKHVWASTSSLVHHWFVSWARCLGMHRQPTWWMMQTGITISSFHEITKCHTESFLCTNFVVPGGIRGYCDSRRCRQWRKRWHHDDSFRDRMSHTCYTFCFLSFFIVILSGVNGFIHIFTHISVNKHWFMIATVMTQ